MNGGSTGPPRFPWHDSVLVTAHSHRHSADLSAFTGNQLLLYRVYMQVTPEQVSAAVAEAIESKKDQLIEER
jgi:hypothetical protein